MKRTLGALTMLVGAGLMALGITSSAPWIGTFVGILLVVGGWIVVTDHRPTKKPRRIYDQDEPGKGIWSGRNDRNGMW